MLTSRPPSSMTVATLVEPQASQVYSKVARRILPLLFFGYLLAYLDRINIGFAEHALTSELGLTPQQYGFGAAIFFAGYLVFQIPSNLLLEKMGARRSLSQIMILWGLASATMAFVDSAVHLYLVRVLLGVAEAGFFPGVVLYLTYWLPAGQRARVLSLFMLPLAFAGFIGGPLSGLILGSMPTVLGLTSWHWMFLIEAAPSVVLGCLVWFLLPDGPASANWLNEQERSLIRCGLDAAVGQSPEGSTGRQVTFWSLLRRPRLYALFIAYFAVNAGISTTSAFLPAIIRASGYSTADFSIGLLVSLPYAVAALTMYFSCRWADRLRSRLFCPAVYLLGAAGFLCAAWLPGRAGFEFGLVIMVAGVLSGFPLFWATASDMLPRGLAASSIGLVSMVGVTGAFAAPMIVGKLTAVTSAYTASLVVIGAILASGALALIIVHRSPSI